MVGCIAFSLNTNVIDGSPNNVLSIVGDDDLEALVYKDKVYGSVLSSDTIAVSTSEPNTVPIVNPLLLYASPGYLALLWNIGYIVDLITSFVSGGVP